MEKLLHRLERRFGRFAIHNLTWYLVGLTAAVFVLNLARPGFLEMLLLDPHLVFRGEAWRLITFVFIPPEASPIWILFALYFMWLFGTALEAEWGAFRYNLFYLLGMLGTTAAAFVMREPMGNSALNMTIFLAFATLFPNFQILLFFILPVKVKWLAWIAAATMLYGILVGDGAERVATVVAAANYLLFFSGALRQALRRGARRVASATQAARLDPVVTAERKCAACGRSDRDPTVDIRVCSCEKCGKPTEYCLEHARNH